MPPATVTTLFIASLSDANWPLNPTTAAVDLQTFYSTGVGFGLIDDSLSLDTGTIETTDDLLSQAPHPGATFADRTHPPVTMKIPLFLKATSMDDAESRLWALLQALDPPDGWGVLVWQPKGSSTRGYFDFFPAKLAGLFRGNRRGMYRIIEQLRDPDGYPLELLTQPYIRRDPVANAINVTLKNQKGSRHVRVTNPGSAPGLLQLTATPEATSELVELTAGVRQRGTPADYEALYSFRVGTDATLDVDTTQVADGTVDGGQIAVTDFSTTESWIRRWWYVLGGAGNTGTQGRMIAYALVELSGPGIFEFQLKWNDGNAQPTSSNQRSEHSSPVVRVEGSDLATFHWISVDLGEIDGAGNFLFLSGHARRVQDELDYTSTATLKWHEVFLAAADKQHQRVRVPQHSAPTHWHGKDLLVTDGSPAISNHSMVLSSVNDRVVTPYGAAGYYSLTSGRWMWGVRVRLDNKLKTPIILGYIRVRKQSDGSVVSEHALRCRKGQRTTKLTRHVHIKLTASANYRVEVALTASPSGSGAQIVVEELTQHVRRYVDQNGSLVIDGLLQEAWDYYGAQKVAPLSVEGSYLELPAGDSTVVMGFGDAQDTGYDHAHGGHHEKRHHHKHHRLYSEGFAKHVISRAVAINGTLVPRDMRR